MDSDLYEDEEENIEKCFKISMKYSTQAQPPQLGILIKHHNYEEYFIGILLLFNVFFFFKNLHPTMMENLRIGGIHKSYKYCNSFQGC